jgi:hypothetical protein
MITLGIEDEVRTIVGTLITIQSEKKYNEKSANFLNIVAIIKGLFEECRDLSIPLLNGILLPLINKKTNKEVFLMSHKVLLDMKNILSAPINQLIFQLVKDESPKDYEITKITGQEFVELLKNLCKISPEYLINFLSTLNSSDSLKKTKIRNASHFDIFNAIFSNTNSLLIAKDYSQQFSNYLECFSSKSLREMDKFMIFKSLLKFLYNNNKEDIKLNNLYYVILQKIKNFLEESKSEEIGTLILDFISKKLFKGKKVPVKIIEHVQVFLDSKLTKLNYELIKFNFNILNNKIIKFTSLFDLCSTEKKMTIAKFSFIFNNLLNRYEKASEDFKRQFDINLFQTLCLPTEANEKMRIFNILFTISLNDMRANPSLHKYFLESSGLSCVVLNFLLKDESQEKSLGLRHPQLSQKISNSQNKLAKEGDFIKKIQDLPLDSINKIKILFERPLDESISNETEGLENFNNEEVMIFRRALMLHMVNNEVNTTIEFANLLLNTLDPSISDNKQYDVLQSTLSSLFYYVSSNINYHILRGYNSLDNGTKEKFIQIIKFLTNILCNGLTQKEVLNYITAIIKFLFEVEDKILLSVIDEEILKELSKICLDNNQVSAKYLALLYHEVNKVSQEEDYILPQNLLRILYESENKLGAIKFFNEIFKLDKKNQSLNKLIFEEKIANYILIDLQVIYDDIYHSTSTELRREKNLCLKAKLFELISIKSEILKYEFNFLILQSEDLFLNDKEKIKAFTKKILDKLYLLCNYNEDIESNLEEGEDSIKIAKILRQCNNVEICKLINLIFKHFENGFSLKPKHQVKLMNLALFNEVLVREHLLSKLEKSLIRRETIYYHLHTLPILTIFCNDPDKEVKKRAGILLPKFINYLRLKYSHYTSYDKQKTKNVIYKYIPEVYMSYILTYSVFNTNLNLLFQSQELKYFENLITNFLRLLKKITNNNFDSNFLVQLCLKIKSANLKSKKVSKRISHVTYLQSHIKKDNYSLTSMDYETVKNEICSLTIKLINRNFTSNFHYEEIKPNLPLIFTEIDVSFIQSMKKEDETKLDFDLSKLTTGKDYNQTNLPSSVKKSTSVNRSNEAVRNFQLKLEPVFIFKIRIANQGYI